MSKLVEQPKKHGRPNIMEACGITPEQVRECYIACEGNVRQTAEKLGISRRTVDRYLDGYRLVAKQERRVPKTSKADRFLGSQSFKDKTIEELAKGAGVSASAMGRALSRRKTRVEGEVRLLGDFRSPRRSVYDEKRRLIQTGFILSYELDVDRWTLDVIINAVTPAGHVRIRVASRVYRSWFTPS